MKILFVGGTGRLSKYVAKLALDTGHEVTLLTRGSKNRAKFVENEYAMIYGDIRNPADLGKQLAGHHFDVVIDFLSYTVEQMESTLQLLGPICTQYVFISTATVYKKADKDEIISEDSTQLGNDRWAYAYNKYLCEQKLAEIYADKSDSSYTIIRPYVTYGNTRIPYPIVPFATIKEWTLLERALNGRPIPVFDCSGWFTTVTHASDFAKGVVGLFGNPKARNEAFHITSQEEVRWTDVIDLIEEKTGVEIVRAKMSQEDIFQSISEYKGILVGDKGTPMRFDNSKIKAAVPSFDCEMTLREGVFDTVDNMIADDSLKLVDYRWDGRIDRLCKEHGFTASNSYSFKGAKDQLSYLTGKSGVLWSLYKLVK